MGLDLYILKAKKEEDFGNNSFENIISYGGSAAYLTRNLIFEYFHLQIQLHKILDLLNLLQ